MESSLLPITDKSKLQSVRRGKLAGWSFGKVLVVNSLFCTLIAMLIWIAIPAKDSPGFVNNLVHSLAIGTLICTLILLVNGSIRRFAFLPRSTLIFAMPFVVLIGFFLGTVFARFLLQLPMGPAAHYNDRHLLFISLTFTVVVTIAIMWFFTTQSTIVELRIAKAEESERATQAQLSLLLSQIEPHMLFNTMASLRALIQTEPTKACGMLDVLIDFLRATLSHSRAPVVSLRAEFELLQNYLYLMKIRLGERLSFTLELPADIEHYVIPSLLIQPIVENAVKHGIEPSISGGQIRLKAEVVEQRLIIEVEDTGIGMNALTLLDSSIDAVPTGHGFGLQSVRARCNAITGGELTVISPRSRSLGGTRVVLKFPLSAVSKSLD